MGRLLVAVLDGTKRDPYRCHHAGEGDGQEHEVGVNGRHELAQRDVAGPPGRPVEACNDAAVGFADRRGWVNDTRVLHQPQARDVEVAFEPLDRVLVEQLAHDEDAWNYIRILRAPPCWAYRNRRYPEFGHHEAAPLGIAAVGSADIADDWRQGSAQKVRRRLLQIGRASCRERV